MIDCGKKFFDMSIKIALGLQNSPTQYAFTRHNVGAIMLSTFAEKRNAQFQYNKYCAASLAKVSVSGVELYLVRLEGYMNESGVNLKNVLKFLKCDISNCIVLYDDVGLDLGRVKISENISAGGHNGVSDIMAHCGNSFARLRIGIGAKPHKNMDLADYVLGRLSDEEKTVLLSATKVVDESFELICSNGLSAAQNKINQYNKDEK